MSISVKNRSVYLKSTFKTLKKWVEELKNQGPADIAIVVTGNKADLESQRVRRFVAPTLLIAVMKVFCIGN